MIRLPTRTVSPLRKLQVDGPEELEDVGRSHHRLPPPGAVGKGRYDLLNPRPLLTRSEDVESPHVAHAHAAVTVPGSGDLFRTLRHGDPHVAQALGLARFEDAYRSLDVGVDRLVDRVEKLRRTQDTRQVNHREATPST